VSWVENTTLPSGDKYISKKCYNVVSKLYLKYSEDIQKSWVEMTETEILENQYPESRTLKVFAYPVLTDSKDNTVNRVVKVVCTSEVGSNEISGEASLNIL
jgi:hypothetical protein